jgi:acetyl-CoA acetyltransferase
MMDTTDVVILSAARTPIGKFGGSLCDVHPAELGAVAARAAIERAGMTAVNIHEVVIGHARQAGSGPNTGRQVGVGPAPATRQVLARVGLSLDDIDLIEVNEAFAGQYLAVEKDLGLDRERVNVNGGAIALGHPLGMTGTRLLLTLLLELRRRGKQRGLATACIGGGQGIAAIVETV